MGPSKAVAGGTGESVVVIVPAFAHGEDAEEEIVAAGVGRLEGAAAEGVTNRINRPGDMLVHKEANESPPNQTTEGAQQDGFPEKASGKGADAGGDKKAGENPEPPSVVNGDDDGIFEEGRSKFLDVGFKVIKNPTGVGVPEAFEGAVGIFLFV